MEATLISRFAALFAGRTDIAGVHIASENRTFTERPEGGVTEETYRAHLEGRRSLGIAPLRDDGTVSWFAFDVDVDDQGLTRRIRSVLAQHGFAPYIERTKSKGYHVWCFLSEPTPAKAVRALATQVLVEADAPSHMEVFPKQTWLREGQVGNWINLPYYGGMPDKRVMIDDDGQVIPLQTFLAFVQRTPFPQEVAEALHLSNPGKRGGAIKIGFGDRREYDGPPPACVLHAMQADAPEGTRNDTAARLVGYWAGYAGLDDDEVSDKLHEWNEQLADPLSEHELEETIRKVSKKRNSWGCARLRELPQFRDGCIGPQCGLYRADTFGTDNLPLFMVEQPQPAQPTPRPKPAPAKQTTLDDRQIADLLAAGNKSWLKEYIAFARTLTDSPRIFHAITGLSLLATAAGNRVLIPSFGGRDVFPNLYFCIVSQSGFMRKSTATGIGLRTLAWASDTARLPDEMSNEAFVMALADQPTGLLRYDEFGATLANWNKRDWQSGMKGYLTTFYEETSYDKLLKGIKGAGERTRIENIAVTMLATTTVDWLQTEMKLEDLRAGFLARVLWIWAEHKEPRLTDWPFDTASTYAHLADHLSQLFKVTPPARADLTAVKQAYFAWEGDFEDRYSVAGAVTPEISGVVSRVGGFVQKVAVLLALSDRVPVNGIVFVRPDHLERAITFVEWCVSRQQWLVNEQLQFSKFERYRNRLLEALKANGGRMRLSEVYRLFGLVKREVMELLETMVQSEYIRIVTPAERGAGRPGRIIALPDCVFPGETEVA